MADFPRLNAIGKIFQSAWIHPPAKDRGIGELNCPPATVEHWGDSPAAAGSLIKASTSGELNPLVELKISDYLLATQPMEAHEIPRFFPDMFDITGNPLHIPPLYAVLALYGTTHLMLRIQPETYRYE